MHVHGMFVSAENVLHLVPFGAVPGLPRMLNTIVCYAFL